MKILSVRHNYPEKSGWELIRNNSPDFILLHFLTPVAINLNNTHIQAEPGNAIIFSPYTSQHLVAKKPLLHNWMHLQGAVTQNLELIGLRPDTLYTPAYADKITDIFQTIESEFFAANTDFAALSALKLKELFFYIKRHNDNTPQNEPNLLTNRLILSELRQNLIANLEQPWSIEKMCKYTSMSQSRLFSLYKSIYGISPVKDLIHARIERAKNLLAQKPYTNAQLCKLCGFNNEYYFIRQFKQLTGYTPSAYGNATLRPNPDKINI